MEYSDNEGGLSRGFIVKLGAKRCKFPGKSYINVIQSLIVSGPFLGYIFSHRR